MCEFCENPTKWNTDDYSLVPNRNLSDGVMRFSGFAATNCASAIQGILIDAAMPVLREEITSPLSPFRYKDELEKALNDFHFGNMFMNGD